MNQQVIINVGVSGSGKTTWSSNFIDKTPYSIRINRDDLRRHFYGTLQGYYHHKALNGREKYITEIEELLFLNNLQEGNHIVIDNTNLKPSYIERWIQYVKAYNEMRGTTVEVKFKIFPEKNKQLLKERINYRENSLTSVDYIDKQISSLPSAIAYVEDNYKTQIINE